MIQANPIFIAQEQARDEAGQKQLAQLHPETAKNGPCKVEFIFADGSSIIKVLPVTHLEFMKHWKEFGRWFDWIKRASLSTRQSL